MIFGLGEAGPRFRELDGADAQACANIHAQCFPFPWSSLEFEELLANAKILGDGAFGPNQMIAFVLSRAIADEAEILSIGVAKQERRRGIAGRLLTMHMRKLARLNVNILFLEVADDNFAAQRLYMRQGFKHIGRRPNYFRTKDDRRDAFIFRAEW